MAKTKKPAQKKGGVKKAASKKVAKVAPKKLTERQADQLNADKMRADAFASTQSAHPTVEEQYSAEERRRMDAANGLARRVEREMAAHRHSLENPSLLRRALNRVKRAFRFRSAKTGEYVTKKYAEANPDTTVRERVK